jgi:acetyl-CoA carboxylase biotin carboxyl carrier protein
MMAGATRWIAQALTGYGMLMVSARMRRYNGLRLIARCYTSPSPSDASMQRGVVRTGIRKMARIEVKSEITGTVWQITKQPGDKVEAGDTLIVIESMKMEIPVITEDGGTVKEILVKQKEPVAEGQVVAVIDG